MQRELKLPDVGEGIAEGEIVNWLVEPGDQVTEDQPVAEVETDKAVVEVPSPIHGTVTSLHASEGEVVAVGSVIVTFEVDDADADATADAEPSEQTTDETAQASTDTPDEQDTTTSAETETTSDESVPASQVIAPPRTKRLARELGVDIGAIAGAADGEPISDADVRRASEGDSATTQTEPTPATSAQRPESSPSTSASASGSEDAGGSAATEQAAPSRSDRDKTLAAPATRQLARELGVDIDTVPASETREGDPFVTEADVRATASGDDGATTQPTTAATADSDGAAEVVGGEQRIPYKGIRRTIGEQMAEAKYSAPHVSHHDEVDVTELASVRRDLNEQLDDTSLTYMPFVMKAVTRALEEHPEINATLDEDAGEIVQKHYYNLGVATATEAGLMVPVVRDVDQKGLSELAADIERVVGRARNREIAPSEMQGGTFTITNFGAIGGDHATPIINYPEAAILGLGAIKERPQVVDGEVVPRTTLPLSLTVDHRLIDGAIAASFTNDVKRYLNNPELLML
jgi:pyruvate dehydrogenase E2 component (dihydrolipoamide acetyltransferase)